ncbi:MAG: PmeII family type II restriction endonuclease [Candidatus Acidiferrales bacterium]
MTTRVTAAQLEALIERYLKDFYQRRLGKLQRLRIKQILRRKNPYLFRALHREKAQDFVEQLMLAYVSSSDETIFGDAFFEPIARDVSGGQVSPSEGVDIVIETPTKYIAIAMKSGPNIYNTSQKRKQNEQFNSLRARLQKMKKAFDPVLAAGYGRKVAPPGPNRVYRISCGQAFWEELTGDSSFHLKLISLMKDFPAAHKPEYEKEWAAAVNRFTGIHRGILRSANEGNRLGKGHSLRQWKAGSEAGHSAPSIKVHCRQARSEITKSLAHRPHIPISAAIHTTLAL